MVQYCKDRNRRSTFLISQQKKRKYSLVQISGCRRWLADVFSGDSLCLCRSSQHPCAFTLLTVKNVKTVRSPTPWLCVQITVLLIS